jgi:hypothetical protein
MSNLFTPMIQFLLGCKWKTYIRYCPFEYCSQLMPPRNQSRNNASLRLLTAFSGDRILSPLLARRHPESTCFKVNASNEQPVANLAVTAHWVLDENHTQANWSTAAVVYPVPCAPASELKFSQDIHLAIPMLRILFVCEVAQVICIICWRVDSLRQYELKRFLSRLKPKGSSPHTC